MSKNTDSFKKLHNVDSFFVLGNVWDVVSAKIYEKNGYSAIGSSSSSLSYLNGKADGENISFSTVVENAKKILANVSIPYSVDIEKGYSTRLGSGPIK